MISLNQLVDKVCVLCHEDCSSRPRVKDRAGRYYCEACYERAKKQSAARKGIAARKQSVATAAPMPSSDPLPIDDGLDAFAIAAAEAAAAAPLERQPALAAPTAQAPVPTARPRRKLKLGLPDALKQPWIAIALPMLILGVLFLAARNNEDAAILYLLLFALFNLVLSVLVLIQAFRHGIGTFVLSLIVPLYSLYFVFYVNEKAYIKWLIGAVSLAAAGVVWLDLRWTDASCVPDGF